jgi:secreted trypsin-like serine protease
MHCLKTLWIIINVFDRVSAIIEGVQVPAFSYQWLVSIQMKGMHNCGGTLINPTTVITAAHCTVPLMMRSMSNIRRQAQLMSDVAIKINEYDKNANTTTADPIVPVDMKRQKRMQAIASFVSEADAALNTKIAKMGLGSSNSNNGNGNGNGKPNERGLDTTVHAHRFNLDLPDQKEQGIAFTVTDFIPHPAYKEMPLFENDIAILKVSIADGAHWGQLGAMQNVDLDYNGDYVRSDTNLTAAGWGMISSRGVMSTKAMYQITQPVVDSNECAQIYGELTKHPAIGLDGKPAPTAPPGFDEKSAICAGKMTGKQGICQGDSGGPLFAFRNNKPVLVGVASHGYGFECATKGVPDVYARISAPSISDFLKKHIM